MISVILPIFNSDKTLSKAIESVLDQSFTDFELIVIDNNSTDRSVEIITDFQKRDSRIQFIHERNQGIAYALNSGLKKSKFNFVARIDADDQMFPDRLEKQMNYLKEFREIDLVSGKVKYKNESSVKSTNGLIQFVEQINSWKSTEEIFHHRFVESPIIHPSVMLRKTLFERYGNYSTQNIPEDYELWLRLFHEGVRMAKIDDYVVEWTDSSNRLTRTNPNYSPLAFDRVRVFYLKKWLEKIKPIHPIYAIGDGKMARRKIKMMLDFGIQIQGMVGFLNNSDTFLPTISYHEIPIAGDYFFISLVSNRGKFNEVKEFLIDKNYEIEKDFILAS